jgi:hypothetical protein
VTDVPRKASQPCASSAAGLARSSTEPHASNGTKRFRILAGAIFVVVAFAVLCSAKLWRPDAIFRDRENVQITEAKAWLEGRLDLPRRRWDTALFEGKAYSHYPPMFTFIAMPIVRFFGSVPHWLVALVIVLPVPLLAYAFFLRQTGSALWGAILAIGLVYGTSLLPVLDKTLRGAHPYFLNQTLATIGLLLMLIDGFGRRRGWLGGIGLIIAALSRQLTIIYALPLMFVAWRRGSNGKLGDDPAEAGLRKHDARYGPMVMVALCLAMAVATPLTLNALKFGSPFDTGYMHIYAGREEDRLARDAKAWGLFSPHFVPRNLYYTNIGLPNVHRITMGDDDHIYLRPNDWGTGIWWTTPLLLWVLVLAPRIWRDPEARTWLIAAAIVFIALCLFHNTGFRQRGFNRFSLDYVPVLFALIVPWCLEGRRRWITVAMIGWSVLYYSQLAGTNIRVW